MKAPCAAGRARPVRRAEPLAHEPVSVERRQQLVPELLPDEGVQHRVHRAVREGQHLSHVQRGFHDVARFTRLRRQGLAPLERVDQHGDVVGQPAQDEGQHHGQDHPHRLVLLLIARTPQRRHDPAVADGHHRQRQEEARRVAQHAHADAPAVAAFARQHAGHQPHQGARPFNQQAVGGPGARRSHDGGVAVHADARQQEDAAVHRRLLEGREELAQEVSEEPTGVSVDGPEGEGEAEEEVGHRQVHQVGVRAASAFLHGANHIDDHAVADRAEDEHGHVGDRQAQAVESGHGDAAGSRRVVVVRKCEIVGEVVESFQVESLGGQQLGGNKVVRFKSSGGRRTGGRLSSWQ
ncbi:hypothetical protein EYF80_010244 [Liparis tanakae]|uniref:Uncharacterized protein n=1 Tax=Liparis tanakae TaxID=230148 RepID=A0A4Z2IN03_9TELE|nr:hypothetical protein EYF80_010244 [Liparis tanakae]